MDTLAIGGVNVTIGGATIDFGPSALAMQLASVFSVTIPTTNNAYQLASVFSVTTMPASNAYQLAAVFSVSPTKPLRYAPVSIAMASPMYNMVDLPPAKGPK